MQDRHALAEQVCNANLELVRRGLVTYTWGNVSGIDRGENAVVIKPSGVSYDDLTPASMVWVSLDGDVIGGDLRPSSDTPTHLALYRAFPRIGGVAHTHSPAATAFAQAECGIPCLGTTHADHFFGTVPVTRRLRRHEVEGPYEANTGVLIAETFAERNPADIPAVLVAGHGPFTWGADPDDAVRNSVVLECVADMARKTLALAGTQTGIDTFLLERHFRRKHGANAYYGQKR